MRVTNSAMRLELVSRAPIAALFQASLSGLGAIRAFGAENSLLKLMVNRVEVNGHCVFTFLLLMRCLGFYLDALAGLFSAFAVFLSFTIRT